MSESHVISSRRADPALLTRVADGDEKAFTDLYQAARTPILGTVRRVLRDADLSEEVAQDVLLEVWRTAQRFDPQRGSAQSWLLLMAQRRAIDRVRSVDAQRNRDHAWSRGTMPAPADDVLDDVLACSEHDDVRRALASLTPLERQAIELAYYQGLTYREVAERLQVPLATVKSRIRAGLQRLRVTMLAEAA